MSSIPAAMTMSPAAMPFWRAAQAVALVATVALIVGLFIAPDMALTLLWDVAIPILPAVFLIHAGLWRNVCPLGTLNMLANRWARRPALDDRLMPAASVIGIVLLAVMVPARRFAFNTDGGVLAVTIMAVGLLALLLGAVFDRKAGFCSSICPVLPVERLYGQNPLLRVGNARCSPCTACTSRGCPDHARAKVVAQTLGHTRRSHAWLGTSFGIFAASFPGFVAGYNLTDDGPLATAGRVYLTVAACAVASYLIVQLLVRSLRLSAALTVRLLAALAVGLYYWFAAAVIADHLALPASAALAIRACAFGLIALWLWRSGRPAATAGRMRQTARA